jgi:hypothetical protein
MKAFLAHAPMITLKTLKLPLVPQAAVTPKSLSSHEGLHGHTGMGYIGALMGAERVFLGPYPTFTRSL